MISCPQDPGGSLSGVTAWSWDLPTQRNETAGGSCPALPTDSLCYNTRKGLHAPCSDARRDRTFVELLPDRSRWQVPGDFSDLRAPGRRSVSVKSGNGSAPLENSGRKTHRPELVRFLFVD